MSIVYLNGQYLPMEAARISPMDRGFLFGDGIYEVIPSYGWPHRGYGAAPGAYARRAGFDRPALHGR
jgi:branched-subunit amino acid aminotransferase/4-amino-4-deoxychorismate lyase